MPVEKPAPTDNKPAQRGGWGLILLIVLIAVVNLMVLPRMQPQPEKLPYSTFTDDVQHDQVARALIGDTEIQFTLKVDSRKPLPKGGTWPAIDLENYTKIYRTTPVPMDLELPGMLRAHNVVFSALPPQQANWFTTLLGWVIPPVIFLAVWVWLLRRAQMGGPASLTVGKSKARIYSEGITGVTFDQVAGVDEAKQELREVVDFLREPTRFTRLGAKIPKGVLLIGPPGTGKTLLARAVAGEAGVPFYSISGSEFIELFVGVGAARVRDLFEQAKQKAPCIVFIDELDALGKTRGGPGGIMTGNDEREQTLNQLLTEMDGFDATSGVIILAATNRPEVLDPALRRPGRFDRIIGVDPPDKAGRLAILKVHVARVRLDPEVNLEAVASRTPGFVGADLANLVNEAALFAARKNHDMVTTADFFEAIERVVAGLEKKSRVLNDMEKETVAFHESGHAIVGTLMPGRGRVEKISIVPRGVAALGYTLQLPEEERFLMKEDEIRGMLAMLLGGRSGEEIAFGRISTGASDDLQKATDLAERCLTLYGMSRRLGPVTFEKSPELQYLDPMRTPRRAISPQTAQEIDAEVQDLVEGAHRAARDVLRYNHSLLDEMARALLHTEVLEGDTLKSYLARAQMPPSVTSWLRSGEVMAVGNGEAPVQPTLGGAPAEERSAAP
ncbi:MAG: ATP-dependent zinc metalloprotease FtsH [Candidatus Xenobia bacterium]